MLYYVYICHFHFTENNTKKKTLYRNTNRNTNRNTDINNDSNTNYHRGNSENNSDNNNNKKKPSATEETATEETSDDTEETSDSDFDRCPKWNYLTWLTPAVYYHRQCLEKYRDLKSPNRTKKTVAYMCGFLGRQKVQKIVSGRCPEPRTASRHSRVKKAGEAAIGMCFGRTYAERILFLDQLTMHLNTQFPDKITTDNDFLSLGDCLTAIKEIAKTMEIMTSRVDLKSLGQKKTLCTAMIQITNDSVANLPLLRKVLGRRFVRHYIGDLAKTKKEYIAELSRTLGDIKSRKKCGYYKRLRENAVHYWNQRCPENPSIRARHVIFSGIRDFKRSVPQQIQFETTKQLYEDWLIYVVKTVDGDFIRKTDTGKLILPSYQWFCNCRPPWIKKANTSDFSACVTHTNMSWMITALTSLVRQPKLHTCYTSKCTNFDPNTMPTKCSCSDCGQCLLKPFVTKTMTKQVLHSCCPVDYFNYPRSECWRNTCDADDCGDITDFFNGESCKGLVIPDDHSVKYFRLHAYRLSEGDSKQQWTEQIIKPWAQFKKEFISLYRDFISHHIESVSNNRTRSEWVDKKYSEMKLGDVTCQDGLF